MYFIRDYYGPEVYKPSSNPDVMMLGQDPTVRATRAGPTVLGRRDRVGPAVLGDPLTHRRQRIFVGVEHGSVLAVDPTPTHTYYPG